MHDDTSRRSRLIPAMIATALLGTLSAFAGSGRIPSDHDKYPAGVKSVPAVAAQCFACHGPNGQSVYEDWPNLAGQKQPYLLKQLQDFKSGARMHPMMAPIVAHLSDADMKSLADYLSAQPPASPAQADQKATAPMAAVACTACHDNATLPVEPFLHGQKAAYLATQLHAFKSGKRKDPTMKEMVQDLSDKDIDELARHFSSLAPLAAAKK